MSMESISRRAWFGAAAGVAGVLRVQAQPAANGSAAILARIRAPRFADRKFDITRYGAKEGGKVDASDGIRQAIDACSAAGGGRVVVPAGVFLTGPIHLKSGVNLHLEKESTLQFSQDPKQYLPVVFTRWEGTELMNYSPLIYAFEQQNIAVTGLGTLDGGADEGHWWPWKGRKSPGGENQTAARNKLVEMANRRVPVAERQFGEGAYLRPQFVQPYRCTNVLIEGVTIVRSPMWEVHPVLSRNVIVRDVKVNTHGPNNDGCDPESCTDVLIEGCIFDTGDDCIAIKSGRNEDGRRVAKACENLVIRNCTMKDGHGGVTIGSEVSGDVRNVYVDNCRMDSPHLERALRLKTNSYRGGVIENIDFRNVKIGQVSGAIVDVDFYYEEGEGGPQKPVVRNITVEDVSSQKSKYALYLRGFKNSPIQGVKVRRCHFDNVASKDVVENVEGLVVE